LNSRKQKPSEKSENDESAAIHLHLLHLPSSNQAETKLILTLLQLLFNRRMTSNPNPPLLPSLLILPNPTLQSNQRSSTNHRHKRVRCSFKVVFDEGSDEGGGSESRGTGDPSWDEEEVEGMGFLFFFLRRRRWEKGGNEGELA